MRDYSSQKAAKEKKWAFSQENKTCRTSIS
jgi:hypothetical protein